MDSNYWTETRLNTRSSRVVVKVPKTSSSSQTSDSARVYSPLLSYFHPDFLPSFLPFLPADAKGGERILGNDRRNEPAENRRLEKRENATSHARSLPTPPRAIAFRREIANTRARIPARFVGGRSRGDLGESIGRRARAAREEEERRLGEKAKRATAFDSTRPLGHTASSGAHSGAGLVAVSRPLLDREVGGYRASIRISLQPYRIRPCVIRVPLSSLRRPIPSFPAFPRRRAIVQ